MSNVTKIILDLVTEEALDDLDNFGDEAKKSGVKSGKAYEKGFTKQVNVGVENVGASFAKLATVAATAAAAIGGALGGRAAIAAAAEQQESVTRLNQALAASGTFSQEASQSIQNFASRIQETTRFGDELILGQVAIARQFARTNEEATALTEAAIELSAATGNNLNSSIVQIGKTFSGLQGEVGESVTEIRNLTTAQLKAGGAVDLIREKFAGTAAALANNFNGALTQASNAFGDLLEKLGEFTTQSPAVVGLIQGLQEVFVDLQESIDDVAEGDVLRPLIEDTLSFADTLARTVVPAAELTVNAFNIAFQSIRTGFAAIGNTVVGVFRDVATFIETTFGVGGDVAKTLQDFSNQTVEDFGNAREDLFKAVNSTAELAFSSGLQEQITTLRAAVETSRGITQEFANNNKAVAESTSQAITQSTFNVIDAITKQIASFDSLSAKAQSVVKKIAGSVQGTLVNGISNGLSKLGQALVNSEKGFGNFGAFVLDLIGTLAIQIGTAIVAASEALLALAAAIIAPFGAGAALALGLGLIVVGGILKGLASSLQGGGVDSTGAQSGGASGQGQVGTSGVPEQFEGPSEEERNPQTAVTVNVQGDILDNGEDTARRIADLLSDSFDSQDLVVRGRA